MPTRVMRGEIVGSDSLSRVSMLADLTFRSLIVTADDYGRIDGRLPALKATLYPMRPEVTLEMLKGWLDELAAGPDPLIERYEVDGRPYLWLRKWETHRGQGHRAKKSKYPKPPGDPRISADVHGSPRMALTASAEIRRDPSEDRESGDEGRESRDESRESGASADVPSADAAGLPRTLSDSRKVPEPEGRIPKPDVFPPESMARLKAWGETNGLSRATLNAALDRFREWVPIESKLRTLDEWESSFQNIARDPKLKAPAAKAGYRRDASGQVLVPNEWRGLAG